MIISHSFINIQITYVNVVMKEYNPWGKRPHIKYTKDPEVGGLFSHPKVGSILSNILYMILINPGIKSPT